MNAISNAELARRIRIINDQTEIDADYDGSYILETAAQRLEVSSQRDYKALWEFLTQMIYDNNEEIRQAIENKLTIDTTPEQFTEIVEGVMRAKL